LRQWEQAVQWDRRGVRKGCEPYTIGSGRSAVLLVHGFNDSPRLYDKMAPLLAEKGFTVRVMRLPGFGERLTDGWEVDHTDWIAAVRSELTDLREEYEEVGVVAHSLGGAVVIRCLVEWPSLADRVVLLAPALQVSDERSPLLSTRFWHEMGDFVLLFTEVTESPYALDTHDPESRDYPWRCPFVANQMVEELFRMLDKNRDSAAQFTTPLMMVLSRDDQVVDWRAAERFYDAARSSDKELVFTRDAGHSIPLDYGWKELALQIVAFLQDEPTAGARPGEAVTSF